MKALDPFLSVSLALLSAGALAQQAVSTETYSSGVAPAPIPTAVSPLQKAEGKAMRKQEGIIAAKAMAPSEGTPVPAATAKVSKAQRKAARAARRAETARANRAGELSSHGEVDALR